MKDYTCYSLKNLIETGRRLAKEKSVVSFDLFDTLLVRRIHDPDLVKLPVARYIATLAEERGVKRSATEIQDLRDRFETGMRAEIGRIHTDHEACYPVFMERLLVEIFGEAGGICLAS